MPTLKLIFYEPTCLLSSNLMLFVVAHIPGALGGFVQYICDACARQEPKRQGRRTNTHMVHNGNRLQCPAFLTPDEK